MILVADFDLIQFARVCVCMPVNFAHVQKESMCVCVCNQALALLRALVRVAVGTVAAVAVVVVVASKRARIPCHWCSQATS